MKPGRELDALVAENVFGIESTTISPTGIDVLVKKGTVRPIPHYSTNIAAAWEVVERFSYFTITQSKLDKELYHAEFKGRLGEFFIAEGESAPHAICLAALKAVGVEL